MSRTKHQKTLDAIFKSPTSASIRWRDIETMLIAFDADISEGSGSRVRIKLNDERITLHRPHPNPNTDKGAVVTLRSFLKRAGIKP